MSICLSVCLSQSLVYMGYDVIPSQTLLRRLIKKNICVCHYALIGETDYDVTSPQNDRVTLYYEQEGLVTLWYKIKINEDTANNKIRNGKTKKKRKKRKGREKG